MGSSSAFSEPEMMRNTELPLPKTVSASLFPPESQPANIIGNVKTASSKAAMRFKYFIKALSHLDFFVKKDICTKKCTYPIINFIRFIVS